MKRMTKWNRKKIRGKLADFKKPITKSSRVENLAKCQTNSKVLDQVKSCLGSSNVSSYSFTFRRPMCQSCHMKISAFTAQHERLIQYGENLSAFFLNRTDFMKSLSVPHYQCKSQTNFMKIFSKIINFIILTYF